MISTTWRSRWDLSYFDSGYLHLASTCAPPSAPIFAHKEELGDWAWHLKPIGGACWFLSAGERDQGHGELVKMVGWARTDGARAWCDGEPALVHCKGVRGTC
ncbi:hypothetical protein Taro_044561 [Colocasia esculenta]|uniref:Uncharacterized protein n=1 Tax=Colocasia esculenta TaxID=4460 RepID=A0A843WJI1_COLES|nr:hypothetical protein [Colocasia esculenta]